MSPGFEFARTGTGIDLAGARSPADPSPQKAQAGQKRFLRGEQLMAAFTEAG